MGACLDVGEGVSRSPSGLLGVVVDAGRTGNCSLQ
jgi:hypothetical protein